MKKSATPQVATTSSTPTAWSVNSVRLLGRVAAEPSVRETKNGHVASFRIATNDTRLPEFHDVVLWGDGASDAVARFPKGSPVEVTGRLRTRLWTGRDDNTRRSTEIVATALLPFVVLSA